jgi:glycine/D-amino acid oxidase-like deaminating enzyme
VCGRFTADFTTDLGLPFQVAEFDIQYQIMSRSGHESIVILGAGIIGLSTAYYLSTSSHAPISIYVLDNSPVLFQCASGRAAGFIAKDWFSPLLTELGELSFRLHKELAEEFDGRRRWGYSESVGLSLAETTDGEIDGLQQGSRGEDWLFEGQSRQIMAEESFLSGGKSRWPEWLNMPNGNILSNTNTTAQV